MSDLFRTKATVGFKAITETKDEGKSQVDKA